MSARTVLTSHGFDIKTCEGVSQWYQNVFNGFFRPSGSWVPYEMGLLPTDTTRSREIWIKRVRSLSEHFSFFVVFFEPWVASVKVTYSICECWDASFPTIMLRCSNVSSATRFYLSLVIPTVLVREGIRQRAQRIKVVIQANC